MKPRILQLVDSFNEGGSERQALQLTRLLRESGRYEVFLASLNSHGVLRAELEGCGLGEIPAYPLNSFYDRNAISQLRRFVRHLRELKIDLIHAHDFYTNVFGMTAGLFAGTSIRIASRRETDGMRTNGQQRVQKFAYRLAHGIVANSRSVCQKLTQEGIDERKISVIYNGLDVRRTSTAVQLSREEILRWFGITEFGSRRMVTLVANMRHAVKDHAMFLRAAKQIKEAYPNVGFLLAGEGGLQKSLEEMAKALGIADETVFLGRCEAIGELLHVTDVCVLSSRNEGFSNSILEYMAAARPVVATDVGGAREAIVEGKTGYLTPSSDDRAMAKHVVSLLRDPEKARVMGEQGRRIVEEKFSTQSQLRNTESLYEKLLATKRGAIGRLIENSTVREGAST